MRPHYIFKKTRKPKQGKAAQLMETPLHIPLMEWAGKLTGIEHQALPRQVGHGLGVVGPALESPFFTPKAVPATMSVQELLEGAPRRRDQIIASMKESGLGSNPGATKAAYRKTRKEVAEKTMSERMTYSEVSAKHGPLWNLARCFGIEQGVDADGNPKYRAIHDHSENGNNGAASRTQKVPMVGVHTIMLLVRLVALTFVSWGLQGSPKRSIRRPKGGIQTVSAPLGPR